MRECSSRKFNFMFSDQQVLFWPVSVSEVFFPSGCCDVGSSVLVSSTKCHGGEFLLSFFIVPFVNFVFFSSSNKNPAKLLPPFKNTVRYKVLEGSDQTPSVGTQTQN